MFVVYWIEKLEPGSLFPAMTEQPRYTKFEATEMNSALTFMEMLRKDPANSFVTFASENPNSVGKPGVDVTGPDYNWKKRRD